MDPSASLVDSLVAVVVPKVLDALRERETVATYYDQRSSPFPRAVFLRLAAEGAFLASRVGKLVLARRADVDAFIAAQRRIPRARRVRSLPKQAAPTDARSKLLADLGLEDAPTAPH